MPEYLQEKLGVQSQTFLADDKTVDVISLAVSLRDIADERVEQCVEDMMEDFPLGIGTAILE